jgi:hypothetical protein
MFFEGLTCITDPRAGATNPARWGSAPYSFRVLGGDLLCQDNCARLLDSREAILLPILNLSSLFLDRLNQSSSVSRDTNSHNRHVVAGDSIPGQ